MLKKSERKQDTESERMAKQNLFSVEHKQQQQQLNEKDCIEVSECVRAEINVSFWFSERLKPDVGISLVLCMYNMVSVNV